MLFFMCMYSVSYTSSLMSFALSLILWCFVQITFEKHMKMSNNGVVLLILLLLALFLCSSPTPQLLPPPPSLSLFLSPHSLPFQSLHTSIRPPCPRPVRTRYDLTFHVSREAKVTGEVGSTV